MSAIIRQESLIIEEKLAQLNLTSAERNQALGAIRTAEAFVDLVEAVGAGMRRIADALSLKPSLKH